MWCGVVWCFAADSAASKAEAVVGLLRGCTELILDGQSLSGAACEALSVVLQVSRLVGAAVHVLCGVVIWNEAELQAE